MNNTKWLRRALLGGAALSVMATGAQADDLAALKAQLEVLQSRVSQLESQPSQAALPPGTKLLTVRKGQGTYSNWAALPAKDRLQEGQGHTIAITPTADMPAPVSEVTVSGEIRARALYSSFEVDNTLDLNADDTSDSVEDDYEADDFDITSRGRLRVDGRTETAIGEIGGTLRIQGTQNDPSLEVGAIDMNIIWGYWQMTPNFQLGAGYYDSLAAVQAGWDWNGEPSLVGLDAGPTNTSNSQIRLTYNQGGLTLAVAVEDNNFRESINTSDHVGSDLLALTDAVFPAVAGYIGFDTGSFLLTASAIWQPDDTDHFVDPDGGDVNSFSDTDDNWMVGVGAIVRVSDMFRLEGAANIGEGYTPGTYVSSVDANCTGCSGSGEDVENDFEYWGANVMAVVSFHEAMRLELGAAYSKVDHEEDELGVSDSEDAEHKAWTVAASLFWDPVDQLTLGAGVGWTGKEGDDDDENGEYDAIVGGFGAWFRF